MIHHGLALVLDWDRGSIRRIRADSEYNIMSIPRLLTVIKCTLSLLSYINLLMSSVRLGQP
jgi:hypothetical protein